jgi:histidine-containing phosphotransfer peotein
VQDSQTALQRIHDMLSRPNVDFGAIDSAVHQLKGSSASFGAHNITSLCMQLRHAVQRQQTDAALQLVQQLGSARQTLHEKLSAYMSLEAQKAA